MKTIARFLLLITNIINLVWIAGFLLLVGYILLSY